jgi:predicted acylesterase/phospholipase RssA
MRKSSCSALLIVFFLTAGCRTLPFQNAPLDQVDQTKGYRFANLEKGEGNSDSLYVVLTFSGGGTRAAAFSYGVLEKLRDTEIVWEGKRRRLLDEVDVISSVSGGSLTSAYYAMFGDRIFEDYPDKVLYTNIQRTLIRSVLNVVNYPKLLSPFYGRTDLLAEQFDRDVFEHKTYADLLARNRRPYLVVNSTDLTLGTRFEFTQGQFDLLYSDLNSCPLGFSVAASAAFPGLLTPVALKDYEKGDENQLPPWAREALKTPDPEDVSYITAKNMASYVQPGRPYIHLVDGGVSDNLGLVPVVRLLRQDEQGRKQIRMLRDGTIKKFVIITVNAKCRGNAEWDLKAKLLGLLPVLLRASTTPMENFSEAQIEYLRLLIDHENTVHELRKERAETTGTPVEPGVDFKFIEVAFDRLSDPEKQAELNTMPTSFSLHKDQVDLLRAAAGQILEEHKGFQELVKELGIR